MECYSGTIKPEKLSPTERAAYTEVLCAYFQIIEYMFNNESEVQAIG
jgi:hypothetical protein